MVFWTLYIMVMVRVFMVFMELKFIASLIQPKILPPFLNHPPHPHPAPPNVSETLSAC